MQNLIDSVKSPDEYKFLGRWVCPVLASGFWSLWSDTEAVRAYGFSVGRSTEVIVDHRFCVDKTGLYGEIAERVYGELHAPEGDRKTIAYIFGVAARLEERARKILDTGSDMAAADLLGEVFAFHEEAVFPWMAMFAFQDALERYIAESEKEDPTCTAERILGLISPLSTDTVRDADNLRRYRSRLPASDTTADGGSLLERVKKSDHALYEELMRYQRETEWMGTHHFWGEPRDEEAFVKALLSVRQEESTPSKVNDEGDLPEGHAAIIRVASKTAYWRLRLAELVAQVTYQVRPLLTTIAQRSHMEYEDIIYV